MAGFHGNGISGWVEFVAIGITLPLSTIDEVGIMEERQGFGILHHPQQDDVTIVDGWISWKFHISGQETTVYADFKFVITKAQLVHLPKRQSEHQNQHDNQTRGKPQLIRCRVSKPL
jgi:hypothetical protein